jgi:MoxR-like ATPase
MFNIPVDYPSQQNEATIVKQTTTNVETDVEKLVSGDEITVLQRLVRGIPVADSVVDYAVALSRASRPDESSLTSMHRFIRHGASPRASQNMILGAKAKAVLEGRFHVDFQDVQAVAVPVMRHRLVLNFHARAESVTADDIIRKIVETVPCR